MLPPVTPVGTFQGTVPLRSVGAVDEDFRVGQCTHLTTSLKKVILKQGRIQRCYGIIAQLRLGNTVGEYIDSPKSPSNCLRAAASVIVRLQLVPIPAI